ncbi:glycosyltransferase family 39 protein [bacterium]|nr:glycosyltransferase family 39 protein [bacterium]
MMAYALLTGISTPLISDSDYFKQLAQSVSETGEYKVAGSHWPDDPSARRLPAWPIVSACALSVSPFNDDATIRCLAAIICATSAMLLFLVGSQLAGSVTGCLASTLYVFHPATLHYTQQGLSEGLFILLAFAGTFLWLKGNRYSSAALWGLSVLVRANFLSFLPFFAILCWSANGRCKPDRTAMTRAAVLAAIFCVPVLLWAARNTVVTGKVGVISTLKGQTLYGGNNDVVLSDGDLEGYWISPDKIPNEIPMKVLAENLNELQVDEYYTKKGWAFIINHLNEMPGFCIAKATRAFVPTGGDKGSARLVLDVYRALVLVAGVCGLIVGWVQLSDYRSIVLSVLLTTLLTVCLFWGSIRFAYIWETFLIEFAAFFICTLFAENQRS